MAKTSGKVRKATVELADGRVLEVNPEGFAAYLTQKRGKWETEASTGALKALKCRICGVYFTIDNLKAQKGYPICPDCNGKTRERGVQYWY